MTSPSDEILRARAAIDTALRRYQEADLSWLGHEPPEGGWGLAPDALRFVGSLVRCLRPRRVLEFGCGTSTLVLAHACHALENDCTVTSVENDPHFRRAAEAAVREHGHGSSVKFPTAFLVAREWAGRMRPTYLVEDEELSSARPVDLVLIDGPTSFLGGRSGTLHQALPHAQRGAVVLVDDADRAQEREALAGWRDHFGDAIETTTLSGFAKGLATIIVHAPGGEARA
jgi:predicted O-methyltransferase YrrM